VDKFHTANLGETFARTKARSGTSKERSETSKARSETSKGKKHKERAFSQATLMHCVSD